MVWSYPASSTLRLDHLRPSRPIDIIGIDDRHGSESPIDMRRNRRSTWVGLRTRGPSVTTGPSVARSSERHDGPWSDGGGAGARRLPRAPSGRRRRGASPGRRRADGCRGRSSSASGETSAPGWSRRCGFWRRGDAAAPAAVGFDRRRGPCCQSGSNARRSWIRRGTVRRGAVDARR